VQHPSDRLPAEGRLGSSENTSAPRLFCFLACTGPLFIDKSYLTFEDLKIELRYGTVPSPVLKLTRKFQMSKWKEQKKKKNYSQTSRLENFSQTITTHNSSFDCAVALCAQCNAHYW
jgi:hypothetical protein